MTHVAPYILKVRIGEIVTIKAVGDIHHLLRDSDENRLIEDLKDRPTDKVLYIDMGDSLDSIGGPAHKYFSPERVKLKFLQAGVPLLNAELNDLCDIFKKYTKPKEWLGHFSGNHPLMLLSNGLDLSQELCSRLGHRYLGYQAYVPISIDAGGRRVSLMMLGSHGFGGAGQRWEGSALNAYIQHALRYDGWDIALYGHRHDKWVKPLAKISPYCHANGKRWVRESVRLIAQTGTYLRTLTDGPYPSEG